MIILYLLKFPFQCSEKEIIAPAGPFYLPDDKDTDTE